jgi:uncharacterized protein DUF3644
VSEKLEKLKHAYKFFQERASSGEKFGIDDIVAATGWKATTVRTYLAKQWAQFVERNGKTYQVLPEVAEYPEDVFLRINSQKFMINKDPFKPVISKRTEELVTKSRQAALLAVQVYNNPMMTFRTPSFIVHMVIAYTSLFHAVFEEEGREYVYTDDDGKPLPAGDGGPKFWELSTCVSEFWGGDTDATRKNLELFIPLRNQIEHRFAPAFDNAIAGECQANLLNYERLLVEHFSPYYSIGANISVPLQLAHNSDQSRISALKELQKNDYKVLAKHLNAYRASLTDGVFESPEYCFRVFLIPMTANREKTADMTMEFIHPSDLSAEDLESLQEKITLIKTKRIEVVNRGKLKPNQIVELIQKSVEPRFRVHDHTCAWKYYEVRPREKTAVGCSTKYCQYDEAHRDFVYTQEWVEFLKIELQKSGQYEIIRRGERQ